MRNTCSTLWSLREMIKVNESMYLDIKFEGFEELTLNQFVRLVVVEEHSLRPPIFELTLFQTDYSLYPHVTEINKPIEIRYGMAADDVETYKFLMLNYGYTPTEGGFKLLITGYLDLFDFYNKAAIAAFDSESDKVLSALEGVKPLIDYKGADKQAWIQPNVSNKTFAESILKNAYIAEDDFILSALTVKGELVARSVKQAFKEEPIKIFREAPMDENLEYIRIASFSLESDSAMWSHFLSEGKQQPLVSVGDRSLTSVEPQLGSVKTGESFYKKLTNRKFPPLLDAGNCHDNYYKAGLQNLNYSVQFMRNNVYLKTARRFISNEDLKMCDLVQFIPDDRRQQDFIDAIQGKYFITAKKTAITTTNTQHAFVLNRDYHVQ